MPFLLGLIFLGALLSAPNLMAAPDLSTAWTTLGVSEQATNEEIKAAYRKAAKEYSPNATGVDRAKAELFPVFTMAKDLLLDKDRAAIYARLVKFARTSGQALPSVRDLSEYGSSRWAMLAKEIDAHEQAAAEKLRRNPPVEDVINFEHVLYGSVTEERLVTFYSSRAALLGDELRAFLSRSYPKPEESKLKRLISELADDALELAVNIKFVIDGKRISFSDDFTAGVFRERVRYRLMKMAYVTSAESLANYAYSNGEQAYSRHFRSYLDDIMVTRSLKLSLMINLLRANGERFGLVQDTIEYALIKAEPAKWAATMNSTKFYVFNQLPKSAARENFVEFLERFEIPWAELQNKTPLQKLTAATVVGARCVAFTAHGGFAPIETFLAFRKQKAENSEK